jgi:hypothetical protein
MPLWRAIAMLLLAATSAFTAQEFFPMAGWHGEARRAPMPDTLLKKQSGRR